MFSLWDIVSFTSAKKDGSFSAKNECSAILDANVATYRKDCSTDTFDVQQILEAETIRLSLNVGRVDTNCGYE